MLDKQQEAVQENLRAYKKLSKINKSDEFDDFFQYQVTQVVQKMLSCFTQPGEKSPAPKNWDEFCILRGEILGMLIPMQQIRGADFIVKQLQEQIDNMYNQKMS